MFKKALFIGVPLLALLLVFVALRPGIPIQDSNLEPSNYQLSEDWDKDEQLKTLTTLQYRVTQEDGTEPPFNNAYWDNKADGIYVDIVSHEPLFSSTHKYKSGTGWPSFYQPIALENIILLEDNSLFTTRTEVRSKLADSHLGHVFNDGPEPTGLRYCMNSASLLFIPLEEMEALGYADYLYLFND